ncbi:MAG TPA: N-acetylmuramoyl-L-alanine amidase, partial [Thermodesulfovibrionales bacterium]|nr:N-acetylmuramoyl-L-alanine amidase [Thermodesulfovibrionales bacterium]
FVPQDEVVAHATTRSLPDQRAAASYATASAPALYGELLGDRDIPLRSVFGLGVQTIMIDAGHGGSDSGTIGKMGTMEKDITLDIAQRLKARLLRTGKYRVVMTRDDDSRISLGRRVEMARNARADLFISVHLNYLPQKPINIVETYYFGTSSDDTTVRLAQKENAESEYRLSDFKDIIEKIGRTMKLQESKDLASAIQRNLFQKSRQHNVAIQDFGVKRAPFVVLLGVDVPAVLAEVSCLSNREEEIELASEAHRENIAGYLEAGILDYLGKGDITHEAKR